MSLTFARGRRRIATLVAAPAAALAIAAAGCGGSDSGGAAGAAADYVPAEAPLYLELSTDLDGPQWTQATELLRRFPSYPGSSVKELLAEAAREEGIDFAQEVEPLLGERAAVALMDLPSAPEAGAALGSDPSSLARDDSSPLGVVELADGREEDAQALLGRAGAVESGEHDGTPYFREPDGDTLYAVTDGALLVADSEEVLFRALDAGSAGGDQTLGGTERFRDAIDELPTDVFGQTYVNLGALAALGAQGQPELSQLQSFADIQDAALAASLQAEPRGVRVKGVVTGVDQAQEAGEFSPGLLASAPADAIAYVGFSDLAGQVSRAFRELQGAGGDTANTLAQIEAASGQLQQLLGVSLDDLAALTSGEHGVVVTGGDGTPGVTLVLTVDDPQRAQTTLDRLRIGVPQALRSFGQIDDLPQWRQVSLAGGVTGWQLPLSPKAGIVYGVDGNRVFLGTTPEAVIQAQAPTTALGDSPQFQQATQGIPEEVTGLAWVDVGRVVAEAEAADAIGPEDREAVENVRTIRNVALWSTGGSTPTFEAFATIGG